MEGEEEEEELPVCLPVSMKIQLFLYNWSPEENITLKLFFFF